MTPQGCCPTGQSDDPALPTLTHRAGLSLRDTQGSVPPAKGSLQKEKALTRHSPWNPPNPQEHLQPPTLGSERSHTWGLGGASFKPGWVTAHGHTWGRSRSFSGMRSLLVGEPCPVAKGPSPSLSWGSVGWGRAVCSPQSSLFCFVDQGQNHPPALCVFICKGRE